MNIAHIMLQAKGGAGKTTCCVHLAQYKLALASAEIGKSKKAKVGDLLKIMDSDPSNQSLAAFEQLKVDVVNILDNDENIDKAKFDRVFDDFLQGTHDLILDTGSSNFHAFVSYMKINEIIDMAREHGKHIIFHVPINHDSAYIDTCESLDKICTTFPNANIVVWSNVYTTKKEQVKDFTKTRAYINNDNIMGVVTLRAMDNDTEFVDFSEMLKQGLTYDEIMADTSGDWKLLQKSRLKKIYKEIMANIDDVIGITTTATTVEPDEAAADE